MYVATRAGEEDLKHVESLLRELGLGYIQVEDGEAEEIFPSGHNIRFNRKEFELQVKGKAIALLECYDVLGRDNFQFGRADDPGYVWVSSLEPCNISCSVQEPGMIFWFALNIEKKGAINRMFSTVEVKELIRYCPSCLQTTVYGSESLPPIAQRNMNMKRKGQRQS